MANTIFTYLIMLGILGRQCSSFSTSFSYKRCILPSGILSLREKESASYHAIIGLPSSSSSYVMQFLPLLPKSLTCFATSCSLATVQTENWKNQGSQNYISNILVCGDGDLSFSAAIVESLNQHNVQLIATVLEDEKTHREVYQRSRTNEDVIIRSSLFPEGGDDNDNNSNNRNNNHHHEVRYGVDATKLEHVFPDTKFDRIRFNFPHWRGKANHRYNRQLIDAFLKSASLVLAEQGEIHIALCEGQGGSSAKNLKEYRDTWTPLYYASMYGLSLIDVFPFSPDYNLSSHRGVDRGFKVGKVPEMYVFAKPNGQVTAKQREQMLCCRHELHIVLPENYDETNSQYQLTDFTEGNAIHEIIKKITPDGIHVEVPERKILMRDKTGYDFDMALYLVVYCGESKVLQRDQADEYRHEAECAIEQYIPLRENRRGRLVSRPFPYYLLQSIIDDHTN